MNKCKRFLALLMVLCLTLSIVPFGALAAENPDAADEQVEAQAGDLGSSTELPGAIPDADPPALEEPVEDPVEEAPAEEDLDDETSIDVEVTGDESTNIMLTSVSEVEARDTSADGFYKIVHLDCGRKYFSKDWIIALINEMAADGYNQLQLAFGNDGLRFLLDDMSFTANEITYSHDSVVSAVESGNQSQNSSEDKSWLTQSEMNEIIATANAKNIEIVPLLNLPGHANTILDIANDAYNYVSSSNTLDVTNDSAVNFAYALFTKYVDYFAGKGCKFFNFGADEFANDIYSNSFAGLNQTGYNSFVSFINKLAGYIKEKGMTPRAFNDGLYYGDYSSVSIDTSIQCCYWSSGWPGYDVASASVIAEKGHQMINTNGDFYYVLGKNDQFDSGYSYAAYFSNTRFMGGTVSNPAGSMFCIWCDYPYAESETEIAKNVRLTLRAMAKRMNDESIDNLDESVVSGGFNADGSINTDSSGGGSGSGTTTIQKDGENVSTFSVKMDGTATLTLSDSEATATWTSSNENVATVTAATAARSTDVVANSVTVTPVGEGTATITAALSDGTELKTQVTVTAAGTSGELEYDTEIKLKVGEEKQEEQKNVNNKNHVDRTNLNTDIATVDVTGTDPQEATTTYTVASVTCNTLISGDSDDWTAASGYYYTLDGKNYYPVYAKRSRQWSWDDYAYTYTYTWGYSTTSSAKNVTKIDTQSITDTSDAPNITVYTKEDVVAVDASTTITFKGVYPGETYVKVGDITYKIVVEYKTQELTVTLDQTRTVSVSGNVDTSKLETAIATVAFSADGKTMTVTGVAVGETTVTVGDTIYTIKVTEVDLSAVSPQTIEYWITNGRPTDSNGSNFVSVSAGDAYSESGIAVTSIAPVNTTKETRTLQYWRCRLLNKTLSNSSTSGTEEQTETSGDDETYNGVEFTKVRYWNGTWAVYTVNNEWVSVTSDYQLVAYYLEILPISDELTVTAADWGKKGDGSTSGDYLEPASSCTVSVQVVYEDGTTNPATTTAADLKSCTIAYGYWSQGRGVGTLNLIGLEGYQIWKIEAETGSETYESTSSTWGSYTVDSFTWDNNPMTVYEGEPVDSYIIHNDSNNPSKDGYYENLMWDENFEAILITVYVKAKPTDDNLTVIYYDEKFGDTLYTYSINVNNGDTFDNITPEPSAFGGNADRIDVTGCGVENTLGVTQKFQTDLTKVPEAVGKYNSDLYEYTGSVISEDSKTLYLYYNINTKALSPMYVVDFGLPIEFSLADVVTNVDPVESVSVNAATRYGTLSYDASKKTFTYTPTQILPNIDVLTINIKFDGGTTATTNVGVVPATTVYYEEGFATYTGSWSDYSKGSAKQSTYVAGESDDEYGYDAAYAIGIGASNGTQATSNTKGDTCEFTFTGTGFEVYANCDTETGRLSSVVIQNESGSTVKAFMVDTVAANGDSDATKDQEAILYSLPIISDQSLDFGTYKVTITHITNDKPIHIDGFRIYGTLETEPDFYTDDLEDNPTFIELRDQVLAGLSVTSTGSGQVNAALPDDTTVAVVSSNKYTQDNVNDLLKNGPKNEIFLQPEQALVLKITTAREVQIGLKAADAQTTYTITGKNGDQTINTSTDMFYTVLNKGTSGEQTITITNTGSGILSVTKLKVCDDPGACLAPLTPDDLTTALLNLGCVVDPEPTTPVDPTGPVEPTEPEVTEPEPTEPEVTYADAVLNVSLVDYSGKEIASAELTANGVAGETKAFTAEEVLAAAKANVPDGYAFVDESKVTGAEVAYGETGTVSVQIGKVATLKITYVTLFGKKVGSATITKVQTADGNCTFSASEIKNAAPSGRRALRLTSVRVSYGAEKSVTVTVF